MKQTGLAQPRRSGGERTSARMTEGARSLGAVQEGLASGWCKVEKTCGALSYVNCNVEADGPGYYGDLERGEVLEVCGGACLLFPGLNGQCVQCPLP